MHEPPAEEPHPQASPDPSTDRRTLASGALMAGGLIAGYGTFAAIAGRFLYPARSRQVAWQYVARVADLEVGQAMRYRTPQGATVNVARRGSGGSADDFVALSSTCPHLGCQVHWQPQHNRFFCPCHNGVFSPDGVATAGPPADAGQRLASYPLRVVEGLLYVQVPVERLARADDTGGPDEGPGHDPCLRHRFDAQA